MKDYRILSLFGLWSILILQCTIVFLDLLTTSLKFTTTCRRRLHFFRFFSDLQVYSDIRAIIYLYIYFYSLYHIKYHRIEYCFKDSIARWLLILATLYFFIELLLTVLLFIRSQEFGRNSTLLSLHPIFLWD